MTNVFTSRCLLALLLINFAFCGLRVPAAPQTSVEQLEAKLNSQYAAIEKEIGAPPAHVDFPDTYRMVLRAWQDRLADGTVRNVFPIKSLSHGLTESAMEAARQIRFQPAIRNGEPASQFATFVYEFRKDNAIPYIPRTVF